MGTDKACTLPAAVWVDLKVRKERILSHKIKALISLILALITLGLPLKEMGDQSQVKIERYNADAECEK